MSDSLKKFVPNTYEDRPTWDVTWIKVAQTIAMRSLCSRALVGAVIIDSRNRPVSMGYNGPPSGFKHKNNMCSNWCGGR